ncbi:hypothetical protein D3C81_1842510 [compost metagenome]
MLEEQRSAAHALEGAHRRVHTTRDMFLGIGKEDFGTRHDGLSLNQTESNKALKARARRVTSWVLSALNRAWITASRSAPWSISGLALSRVMPPITAIGSFNRARAWSSSSRLAAGAPGLVLELKKRPKAT